MAEQIVRLENGEWSFDENDRLGPKGGFGEVFRGKGPDGPVAVKRLFISAGAAAHREMKIGAVLAERQHSHVVPIIDYGQDAEGDRYYLVMPVCELSLQTLLTDAGPLNWADARQAVLDIIEGLLEVGDIVHRDLKPGNILRHKGTWRIADFGIAKFVEDATSWQTLRDSLTPPYAAPEQWMGERSTHATDVYALGCIVHAVTTGYPPFRGDTDAIRQQHLHSAPSLLTNVEPRIVGLVNSMLRKSPSARPSLERCKAVLQQSSASTPSSGRDALARAGAAVSEREALDDAKRREEEARRKEREALSNEAIQDLNGIVERLFNEIEGAAESVRRVSRAIVLGGAHLTVDQATAVASSLGFRFTASRWDVAAKSKLSLRGTHAPVHYGDNGVYVFNTTLVFSTTPDDPDFRWREISFWQQFSSVRNHDQPIALDPADGEFQQALSPVIGGYAVAYGPWPIDGEDEEAFAERWLRLFARAADGKLLPSNRLPLPNNYFD